MLGSDRVRADSVQERHAAQCEMLRVAHSPEGGQRDHSVRTGEQRHLRAVAGREARRFAALGEAGRHHSDDVIRAGLLPRLMQVPCMTAVQRVVLRHHADNAHCRPSFNSKIWWLHYIMTGVFLQDSRFDTIHVFTNAGKLV